MTRHKLFLFAAVAIIALPVALSEAATLPDNPLWTTTIRSPGPDRASSITVDGTGNVVVSGWQSHFNNGFTTKFTAAGAKVWTKNAPAAETPSDSASDSENNIYLVDDVYIKKLSPTGTLLWRVKPSPAITNWKSVAVDNNGRVWASGDYSYECGREYLCGPDGVLYKLSPMTGATITFRRSKSTINDIMADRFGNVYSAEYDPQFGANISKYRNEMHKRWAKYTTNLNGPIASGFLPQAVATDYEGNVYALGYANLGRYSTTYTLRKYTPQGRSSGQPGVLLWSKDLSNRTNSGWPGQLAVSPGPQGVIFVGYDTRETGPVPPILPTVHLASYTKAGVERWTRTTRRYNQPFFIDAGPAGRLLTIGTQTLLRSGFGFTTLDLAVSKYAK